MIDAQRISPTLLLALCLALTASAAGAQEQPLPTKPPEQEGAAPPQAPPSGPAAAEAQAPAAETPAAPATATPPATTGTPAAPGTAPTAPGAPAPAVPTPPPVNPDLLQFQLKFPEDKGGGSASGAAADLEYKRDNYAVLTGSVHVRYQDIDLQADKAEIDLSTKIVTATGNVIIDQGPRRLTGTTAVFDLGSKTGTLTEATGKVAPDYYFSGTKVSKVGDNTYTVEHGIFTSCDQKVPDWSFRLGSARVEVDEYAHVHNASMLAKKLPVLYTPYILWPVKSDRSSGFLVPNIGYSQRRGVQLGLAYFQTLGRSYDTTFHVDLYSKNFLGLGDEFRYRPSEGTSGNFIGYIVRDSEKLPFETQKDQWRWKMELNHVTTDLPWGMRGLVHYLNFSDFNFFRDFERDFDRNTLRFIDSRASATGNWGPHLFNFLLNDRETFVSNVNDDSVVQRKLPELEYRLRSTRLGRTPFYLELDSSLSYLDLARPGAYEGQYGRIDAFPQVTLPIRSFPWLSLSVTGGERLTWYGDSLNRSNNAFTGQAITRALPYGSAEVVGPSFSRIFDLSLGSFGKFKNVIEPRFTYTYQGTYDDQVLIPQFDEIDPQGSANAGRIALDSRVLGKPSDETKGSAREVMLFEIARRYSFDDTQPLLGNLNGLNSQAGPLEGLLRFNPSERTNVKLEATYDTLYKRVAATGLSGNYGTPGRTTVGVTWFTRYDTTTGDAQSNQVRVNGGFNLLPRKLRVEGQVNYDVEANLLQQQRYVLNWTSQCYGVRLELRDFRTLVGPAANRRSEITEREIRLSLTLKNVGTFLDLTSRSSTAIDE
jgi:LPS-assembly protein